MASRIGNYFVQLLLQSPLHSLLGDSFAVITVTGCKSGKPISTPINVVPEGDKFMVVSMRNRTWWRNLKGGAAARLRHAGQSFSICGQIIEEEQTVADELLRYFRRYPMYAKYFQVMLDAAGNPDTDQIRRVSKARVILRLQRLEDTGPGEEKEMAPGEIIQQRSDEK